MNNNWINFMKAKASPELKEQSLDDLVDKVKTNLVLFSGSAIKAGYLPVVSREKFEAQLNKVKAGNFFRAELKKKFEDVFDLKVSLKGDSIGSVSGSEESTLKSKVPEFFKTAQKTIFPISRRRIR